MASNRKPGNLLGGISIYIGAIISIISIIASLYTISEGRFDIFVKRVLLLIIVGSGLLITGFVKTNSNKRLAGYWDLIVNKGYRSVEHMAKIMEAKSVSQAQNDVKRLIKKGHIAGYYVNEEELMSYEDFESLNYSAELRKVWVSELRMNNKNEFPKKPNFDSGVCLITIGTLISIMFAPYFIEQIIESGSNLFNTLVFIILLGIVMIISMLMVLVGIAGVLEVKTMRGYMYLIAFKEYRSVREMARLMKEDDLLQAKNDIESLIDNGYLPGYFLMQETLMVYKRIKRSTPPKEKKIEKPVKPIPEQPPKKAAPILVAWRCEGCGAPNQVLTEDGLAACEYCNTKYTGTVQSSAKKQEI